MEKLPKGDLAPFPSGEVLALLKEKYELKDNVAKLETALKIFQKMYHDQKLKLSVIADDKLMVAAQKAEIVSLKGTLKEREEKQGQMEKTLKEMKATLEKTENENKKWKKKVALQEEELGKLREGKMKLRERRAKIEELKGLLKKEKEERAGEAAKSSKTVKELKRKVEKGERLGGKKEEEIVQCRKEISRLEDVVQRLEETCEVYKARAEDLEKELETTNDKHAATVREYDSVVQACQSHKKVIEQQKEHIDKAADIMISQQQCISIKEEKVTTWEREKDPLETKVERFLDIMKVALKYEEEKDVPVGKRLDRLSQKWIQFMEHNGVEWLQNEVTEERAKCKQVCDLWDAAENKLSQVRNMMAENHKEFQGVKKSLDDALGEMKSLGEKHAGEKAGWEMAAAANQDKIKMFMEERGRVGEFLGTLVLLSGFENRSNVPLYSQLEELGTHVGQRLELVASFCNLAKSVEGRPLSSEGTAPEIPALMGEASPKPMITAAKRKCYEEQPPTKKLVVAVARQEPYRCSFCPVKFIHLHLYKRHMEETHAAKVPNTNDAANLPGCEGSPDKGKLQP